MMQRDGQGHAPWRQRVREMLPHREGRIVSGHGRGHDALGDEGAELLPVRIFLRAEPRHRALEPLKPRHQALGGRTFHEERLEAEGVEGRGGEHEAGALEQFAELRLARERQTVAEPAQRAEGGDGLEHVAERAGMHHERFERRCGHGALLSLKPLD